MQKATITAACALTLLGCAAPTQKPQLDFNGYPTFSKWLVGINKCVTAGMLAPDAGALGRQFVLTNLNNFSFDPQRMQHYVAQGEKEIYPSQGDCNQIAMEIADTRNKVQAVNQERARRDAETTQLMESLRPKTTTCNKLGNQVVCNSY